MTQDIRLNEFGNKYPFPEYSLTYDIGDHYEVGEIPLEYGLDSPCWIWVGSTRIGGAKDPRIVPQCYITQREGESRPGRWYAYRCSWELHNQRLVPPGCDLHHLCYNVLCVNPLHLEPLTPSQHANLEKKLAKENARLRKAMKCRTHYVWR